MQHALEVKLIVARKYFEQVRAARLETLSLRSQLDALESSLGIRGLDYSKPYVKTSYIDAQPQILDRLRELVTTYVAQMGWQCDLIQQAECVLQKLEVSHRVVLRCYYLQGKTWGQVANRINYSERQAKQIGQDALIAAYEFLDEEAKRNLPNAEV